MSKRLDQDREAKLQPARIESCRKELEALGYEVEDHGTMLVFEFQGNKIKLYPYSGWFTGKGINDGRGFGKLLRQIKPAAEEAR